MGPQQSKPGSTTPTAAPLAQRFASLRDRIEKWIAGPPPSDPLYMSNRTFGQKMRPWLLISLPLLLVAGAVFLLPRFYGSHQPAASKMEPTPAELAAKMLPDLDRIKLDSNASVEVLDAHIIPGAGVTLTGRAKNNTDYALRWAEITFDLTDKDGSQVGGVSVRLDDLAPRAAKEFRIPIDHKNAAFALVREIHTR